MYKLFSSNNLILWFVAPLLLALLWLPTWSVGLQMHSGMPLYMALRNSVQQAGHQVFFVLALLMLFVLNFWFDFLNTEYKLLDSKGNLVILLYSLVASISGNVPHHPIFWGNLFFLLAFTILLSLFKAQELSSGSFNLGILLALASMFHPVFIVFVPVAWISMFTLPQLTGRALLISLFAFILPWVYLFSWQYIVNSIGPAEYYLSLVGSLDAMLPALQVGIGYWVFMAFVSLLILLAGLQFARRYYKMLIIRRKSFRIVFFFAVLVLGLMWLVPSTHSELSYVLAIPAALIVTRLLEQLRQWWLRELLLDLLLLAYVAYKFNLYAFWL